MIQNYIVATSLVFSLALFGVGEIQPSPLGEWGNLSALGALIGVLGFIIMKMLPSLHKKFVEQSQIFASTIETNQAKMMDVLDKMHERSEERQAALTESMARLREQCATSIAAKRKESSDG